MLLLSALAVDKIYSLAVNIVLFYDPVYMYICDWICEKGSYTRIQIFNFTRM